MLRGFCRAIFYDRLCAISHSVANMSYPLTKTETQALTRFPAFTDGCIYRRIGEGRKCRKGGEVSKRVICKYGGPLSLSGLQSIQHTHNLLRSSRVISMLGIRLSSFSSIQRRTRLRKAGGQKLEVKFLNLESENSKDKSSEQRTIRNEWRVARNHLVVL